MPMLGLGALCRMWSGLAVLGAGLLPMGAVSVFLQVGNAPDSHTAALTPHWAASLLGRA